MKTTGNADSAKVRAIMRAAVSAAVAFFVAGASAALAGDLPKPFPKTSDTRLRLVARDGRLADASACGLNFKKNLKKKDGEFCRFDGKETVVVAGHDAFNVGSDFTVEAHVRIPALPEKSYSRIIDRETARPRGGYALALRRDSSLTLWASAKSWLSTDLRVSPGKWHHVGAMAMDNRVFVFCDGRFSTPFDFDKIPCAPSKRDVVIGRDFVGDILDIRISSKALYRDAVVPGGAGDWELPKKYLRDNGFRGDVVLNGFWGARPKGSRKPYYKTRVPAQTRNRAPMEYYREFTLPRGWEKRRVVLEVDPFNRGSASEVYLDGAKVLDIPPRKRFVEYELPGKGAGAVYKLKIVSTNILGDTWLRSYAGSRAAVDDAYLMTSYRKMQVRVRLAGTGSPGETLRPVVRIYSDADEKQTVKTINGAKLKVGPDGRWATELVAPWKSAKLWSRWHPNLYYYTVEIRSGLLGRTADKTLPRRFGFREVWIENGRFVLNGIPVSVVDDVWEGTLGYGAIMREQALVFLKNLKSMGITGGFRVYTDTLLDVGDEVGMLFAINAGSMVKLNIWDPKSGLTAMTGDENIADIRKRIRRWREHPSILMWESNTAYSLNSMHPAYAGQYFDPWFFFPANRNIDRARKAQEIFKRMVDLAAAEDPVRVVGTGTSPFSPVEGTTRYLCYNLDPQEREEFFDYWFRSGRPKVIWVHEFGVPFQGHYFLRRIDHQMPHTGHWPRIFFEAAARLFGEEAYLGEPDETIRRWGRMNYDQNMASPVMDRLAALQAYGVWRAWRTYGLNASGHHVLNSHGVMRPLKGSAEERYGVAAADDPRRPGGSKPVLRGSFPMLGVDEFRKAGKAILRATRPLMAYIGGPDGRCTNKDHLYYSGAKVRKAMIVVNDWDDPVELKGSWRLVAESGKTVLSGALKGVVKPGRRALTDFPIEFDAPAVKRRTDFTIVLNVEADMPGALEDGFAITVFPKHEKPAVKFSGRIWRLNISDDSTHETKHFIWNRDNKAMLTAAGVSSKLIKGLKTFEYGGYNPISAYALYMKKDNERYGVKARRPVTEGTPKPGDLLIIPRHTLRAFRDDRQLNLRLLEEMKFDKLVEEGLRVIVFEQDLPNIFGCVTEDLRPRRVFMAAAGHPVFAGLEPSDLTFWTGSSDLQPDMGRMAPTDWEFPDRVWHVSNTNVVATRAIIRPQVGSVRALAVSGFDLANSPLLEVTRGKGRILFCLMDVTSRYGKDPAATILVDNIFKYMTTVKEPDPGRSTVKFVKADGKEVVERKNLFRAAKPRGSDGWGMTRGELFFRESIYKDNWVTTKLPDVSVPVFAGSDAGGMPSVIRRDGATGLYSTTLDESLFKTGWAKRKVAWLRGAMIVNQGGSLPEGPCLKLHGKLTALYPHVWVQGFVHPYTSDMW